MLQSRGPVTVFGYDDYMTQTPPRLLSRRKCESIQTYLFSKPFELEGVKIGVVKCLPYTKKFYGIAVTHPVRYYYSFYAEPELLVGVIPSGDVETDEAGQEGDDLMALSILSFSKVMPW